jgi:hypothetical protein
MLFPCERMNWFLVSELVVMCFRVDVLEQGWQNIYQKIVKNNPPPKGVSTLWWLGLCGFVTRRAMPVVV